MSYLAIIGREKSVAYAELESVFGQLTKLGDEAVIFESDIVPTIRTLGSAIKIAKITKDTIVKSELAQIIADQVIAHFSTTQVNSVDFGVSVYGGALSEQEYKRLLIDVKKSCKSQQIKCRFVVPKRMELNAAALKHNKLIGNGIELIVVPQGSNLVVGQTVQVQNVDDYSLRDFGRPVRDMKVGMFPPKLAQAMINLAGSDTNTAVYDPFCGSGVVLQEALLDGRVAWGSDISDKMVLATTTNLNWLASKYGLHPQYEVFEADATTTTQFPPSPFVIVTEGYLGEMFSNTPSDDKLIALQTELGQLYMSFFSHLASQPYSPKNIVITLPCWKTASGIKMLEVIDQITDLGYTSKQFESVDASTLIYRRPDQIVGRQILVLTLNTKEG